jgi:hypothetical protein
MVSQSCASQPPRLEVQQSASQRRPSRTPQPPTPHPPLLHRSPLYPSPPCDTIHQGVGYYKPVTQWSKGEYAGASTQQDDLAIMTDATRWMTNKQGWLSYRPDDHGNTAALATTLVGAASAADAARTTASAVGNIERTRDSDWMSFNAGAGAATVTLTITPTSVTGVARSDLDARLDIYAQSNLATPLLSVNPAGALLSGATAVQLPAQGTYYVVVTGVSDGADASVGYSDYGSLGEYNVTIVYPSWVTATPSPPPPSPSPPPPPAASPPPPAASPPPPAASPPPPVASPPPPPAASPPPPPAASPPPPPAPSPSPPPPPTASPPPPPAPRPSPPPSPPPPPTPSPQPQSTNVVLKLVGYILWRSNNNKYELRATYQVADGLGAALPGSSLSVRTTWSSSTGAFGIRTATTGYTADPAGQIVFKSPPINAKSGRAALQINAVTMTGFTWDQAASNTLINMSWSR